MNQESNRMNELEDLPPYTYEELRHLAHHILNQWSGGGTIRTTALVHEAYLKLANAHDATFANRSHFLGVVAKAMRCILVDDVRRRCAEKRPPIQQSTPPDSAIIATPEGEDIALLELHEALKKLAQMDRRKAQIVELRFFGGCTVEEAADALGISPATVKRDWTLAKAWLYREIYGSDSSPQA